jgi:hypothetical protein
MSYTCCCYPGDTPEAAVNFAIDFAGYAQHNHPAAGAALALSASTCGALSLPGAMARLKT